MTYNVFGGTLSLTQSINLTLLAFCEPSAMWSWWSYGVVCISRQLYDGHMVLCMYCTVDTVDVVAFTHFTALIITQSTSLVLTLHHRPTSTPGHVTLTLQ